MYAVIELKGHQWIIKEGDKIDVDNVNLEEGSQLKTDKILLTFDEDGKNAKVWKPYLKWEVVLKVEENYKWDKMHIKKFKNKIRADRNSKGKWFRPSKTRLVVESISL